MKNSYSCGRDNVNSVVKFEICKKKSYLKVNIQGWLAKWVPDLGPCVGFVFVPSGVSSQTGGHQGMQES